MQPGEYSRLVRLRVNRFLDRSGRRGDHWHPVAILELNDDEEAAMGQWG